MSNYLGAVALVLVLGAVAELWDWIRYRQAELTLTPAKVDGRVTVVQ